MSVLTILPRQSSQIDTGQCEPHPPAFSPKPEQAALLSQDDQADPLLGWALFPDFSRLQPARFAESFEKLATLCAKVLDECDEKYRPRWEGTLELSRYRPPVVLVISAERPIAGLITHPGFAYIAEDIDDMLERVYRIIAHLNMVKDSDEIRKAMELIQPKFVLLWLRMYQSVPRYHALKLLQSNTEQWHSLSPEQRHIVTRTLTEMERSGVGLPENSPEKLRFNAIIKRLADLGTRFSNNVQDAMHAFVELVWNKEELSGCSDGLMETMLRNAQKLGYGEGDSEKGPWAISLDYPVHSPFMMFCENRALREKIHRASVTIASEGKFNNIPIINEILQLRQEQAELLGFRNYAEFSMSNKMAERPQNAQKLIDDLTTAAKDHAQRELELLSQFAESQLSISLPLQPWDIKYVSEAYRRHCFRLSDEDLQKYLSFPRVLAGMFELAEELFGVKVREVLPGTLEQGEVVSVWHPDVTVYCVSDAESNETLAYFFADLYSRPEEKKSGAWMDMRTTRRRLKPKGPGRLKKEQRAEEQENGGAIRLPIAHLVSNQTPPASHAHPTLMKFSDVEALFHEFGHCLQHILTRVDHPQASGIKMVDWDFVEVASQFMENFCYDPQWLARFAVHHETGNAMPPEMVHGLQERRRFLAGIGMMRQLHHAQVDLFLHSEFKPPRKEEERTAFEVDLGLWEKVGLYPREPDDRFLCRFTHIFSGDYAAGYYSYKWSEVYSADAYAMLEGLSLDRQREMGRRYRDTILALGGATPSKEVWKRFRGKEEADVKALLKQSGLI
ncbi:uncharacterized protein VTP21DRAFT_5880 [Calcarisporiella thermophila]|uniref:uncharacterized protein n=1 Tax=Calcarisporiella thermophila TaxID=911321 RepID=UPI003743E572